MPLSGSTSRQPSTPPSAGEQHRFDEEADHRMLPREKPSTRSVPISRARRATAAYMVFMAAKLLPIAMMTATKIPVYSMGAALIGLRCVIFCLGHGVHARAAGRC